jgi:hypothetical protein
MIPEAAFAMLACAIRIKVGTDYGII